MKFCSRKYKTIKKTRRRNPPQKPAAETRTCARPCLISPKDDESLLSLLSARQSLVNKFNNQHNLSTYPSIRPQICLTTNLFDHKSV